MSIDYIEAFESPDLIGAYIQNPDTFGEWKVFFRARYGLPMTDSQFEIFKKHTERSKRPDHKFEFVLALCGRKSRKTLMMACDAVYAALFETFWHKYIKPGKKVYLPIVAVDKIQGRECFEYCSGVLNSSPILKREILKERTWDIEFKNGAVIMIRTANFRQIRGPQYIGGGFDELAFLRDTEMTANPADEIIKAFMPALIPGGTLFAITTVYNKQGTAFERYRKYYGKDDPNNLVWVSDTLSMNPLFDQGKIDRALEEDRKHGLAEYYSEFRDDISNFLSGEAIEACVIPGRFELPRIAGVQYFGFLDPSGGVSDSFSCGVTHLEKSGKVILDVLREKRPPFQPQGVVAEFADILKSYHVMEATSDRYAGEWVTEAFVQHGITIKAAEQTASELYLEFLPLISGGQVELLDSKRLVSQLAGLERRTRAGGKDMVTHYAGGHDDLANSAAGVCVLAAQSKSSGAALGTLPYDVRPENSEPGWQHSGGADFYDRNAPWWDKVMGRK